jgi:hypothetical protein
MPTEFIKAGCRMICSEIHKLINSISSKEKLPEDWKESIIVPNYEKCDKTIVIQAYHSNELHTEF